MEKSATGGRLGRMMATIAAMTMMQPEPLPYRARRGNPSVMQLSTDEQRPSRPPRKLSCASGKRAALKSKRRKAYKRMCKNSK